LQEVSQEELELFDAMNLNIDAYKASLGREEGREGGREEGEGGRKGLSSSPRAGVLRYILPGEAQVSRWTA